MTDEKPELMVEHRLTAVETSLKDICENHLPHLLAEIREVKKWVLGIVAGVVVAIIMLVLHHILGS